MKCSHCGGFAADDDLRCPECGTPLPRKEKGKRKLFHAANNNNICRDGLAYSIILTVMAAVCCISPFGLGAGVTSIVLSAVARQELNGKDQARGIRIAGYARIFRIITAVLIGLQALLFLLWPTIGGLLTEWLN